MRRLAEAAAGLQPLQAVDGTVVFVLVRTGLDLDAHQVAGIGAQDRRERVAAAHVVRQRRVERVAEGRVQGREQAIGAGLRGKGEVAGAAGRLVFRRRVEDPRGQRFLAVVDDQGADVVGRDDLRARPRHTRHLRRYIGLDVAPRRHALELEGLGGQADAARARAVGAQRDDVGEVRVRGLAERGRHGLAERLRVGGRDDAGRVDTAVGVLAVGVLEVAELEEELAVRFVHLGGADHRLPGGRPAVAAPAVPGVGVEVVAGRGVAVVEQVARFVVHPGAVGRLGEHGRVQADLLVGRRPEVVVREGDAEAAMLELLVDDRVGEPALQRGAGTEPVATARHGQSGGILVVEGVVALGVPQGFAIPQLERAAAAEEVVRTGLQFGGVRRRQRTRAECRLAGGIGVLHDCRADRRRRVPGVDGVDAAAHHAGREGAVFVVPAVGRAVGARQVPLRQMDVLADDVGRRLDLVVVHLELFRDEIGVQVARAVERVHAQHQRLGRARLGVGADDGLEAREQRRVDVFPERQDALLRVVVAELVEGHVELDVRALVDARRVGIERAGTSQWRTARAEELAGDAGRQAGALVVDAGVEERRASGALGAVGDERGRRDQAARQHARGVVGGLLVEVS